LVLEAMLGDLSRKCFDADFVLAQNQALLMESTVPVAHSVR